MPWTASAIAPALIEYEAALPLGGWPNWVLSNHDKPRICSRAGSDQALVAAVLLLTLRGTPTLYYGDEIGMRDVSIPVDEIRDPRGLNSANKNLTRDPARTPMQWDATRNAGFSTAEKTWLPVHENYTRINVELQSREEESLLQTIRTLLKIRRREKALQEGSLHLLDNLPADIVGFTRNFGEEKMLILLNFADKQKEFPLEASECLFKLTGGSEWIDGRIRLEGYGGLVLK